MSIDNQQQITAVVLTHDEEANIRNCLVHLDWVNRIVVVDSGSTDQTIDIANEFSCDVYTNPWHGFAAQRNWALDNTGITSQWVLFVDADEVITSELRSEIGRTLRTTVFSAFYLCSKVILFGQWVKRSSNFPVWHPRLLRMGKARFRDAVTGHGETWEVYGETGYLQAPYIHHSFSKGIGFWFAKHNRLSDLECKAYLNNKHTLSSRLRILFGKDRHKRRQAMRALSYIFMFRAFFRFVHQYIIRGGILDGAAGWSYCALYFAYEIMISAKIKEKSSGHAPVPIDR